MRFRRSALSSSQSLSRFAIALFTLLCFSLVAATAALAGPTLERIKQAGHIRLGYFGDARPFSFNGPNGPDGYAIELCRHIVNGIAQRLELQKLTQDWKLVSFDKRLRPVSSGDIDLLCAPVSETLGHREDVSFSIPIFAGGDRAVIRADAPATLRKALSERSVTQPVWRGSPAETVLGQTRFVVTAHTPSAKWLEARREHLRVQTKIEEVPDYRAGVRRVLDKKADVFFGERSLVLGVLGDHDTATRDDLVIVDRMFTHESIALALPRGDDDLRLLVDRVLSQLYDSEEFAGLYANWFGEFDAPTRMAFQFAALSE